MSARDKIAANAQEHLDAGEHLQATFAGQPSVRFRLGDRYRTVAVTDRRMLVFDSGIFTQTKTSDLLAELPRSIRFGQPSGLWHAVDLGELSLHVNRRYFTEIAAADAALDGR